MAPQTLLFWTPFLRNCGKVSLCGFKPPGGESFRGCPRKWIPWGPSVALKTRSGLVFALGSVAWGASQLTAYLQGCGGRVLPTVPVYPWLGHPVLIASQVGLSKA